MANPNRLSQSYDFRARQGHGQESLAVYKTTAGALARIMFKTDGAGLSRGTYPGTSIRMRQIDDKAPVTLIVRRYGGRVEDQDGGWIADRFGPAVGVREARRCAEQLEREGVEPELR